MSETSDFAPVATLDDLAAAHLTIGIVEWHRPGIIAEARAAYGKWMAEQFDKAQWLDRATEEQPT